MTLLQSKTLGPDYTYAKRRFLTKIVEVYDGDTVRAVFSPPEIFPATIQYKIRMLGYDSCEIRPSLKLIDREIEKKMAINARDALAGKIGKELVVLECGDFDKNGRILGVVYLRNGENINKWMVDNGYGWPYDGKTKSTARAAGGSPSLEAQRELAQRELAQRNPAPIQKPVRRAPEAKTQGR
jgi:endonuclease YncB( thermonuclease family)